LRVLVERHLEGRDAELKETVVAVEVLGRPADYDPKVDATVRTEAVRLRARLNRYYAEALVKRHVTDARQKRTIAAAYGCLGDAERAFEFLNKAVEEHEPAIAHILDAPKLASMLADPRFEILRRHLNLWPAS
jgi:hypothetical protein